MNLLNLPEWNVISVQENEHDYLVTSEPVEKQLVCEKCASPHLYAHGPRYPNFYHLPMHYKRVLIRAKLARYKCRACEHVGTQKAPNVDEKRDATTKLVEAVGKRSLKKTFAAIVEETGLDERTVRRIFKDHLDHLERSVRFETPEWLGMDEIRIGGTWCFIMTNIKQGTVINLYKSRHRPDVEAYLRFPDREKIKVVTMDMWEPYKLAVREVLNNNVAIVADKFHVTRWANIALENYRKAMKMPLLKLPKLTNRNILLTRRHDLKNVELDKLDEWTRKFPMIRTAYDAKEAFFNLYNAKDKKEARERFEAWKTGLPKALEPYFSQIFGMVQKWDTEIFNYFDHRVTNAFTESMNGIIRHIEGPGRGYSFEAIRAKILYTYGFKRVPKPKFDKTYNRNIDSMSGMFSPEPVQEYYNYGVPISTFIENYEQGDF